MRSPEIVRGLLLWSARLAVTVVILAAVFARIPLDGVMRSLASVDLAWLGAALVGVLVMRLLAAFPTKILCDVQGMSLGVWRLCGISLVATFYGLALPGHLAGGAVRWYKMSQPEGMRSQAMAAIAFDRLVGTAVLAVSGVVCWALARDPLSGMSVGLPLGIGAVGLLGIYSVAFRGAVASWLLHRLPDMRLLPGALRDKLGNVLRTSLQYRDVSRGTHVRLLVFSLLGVIAGILVYYALALGLGLSVSMLDLGWIRALVVVLTLLPISFLGLGVREATVLVLLQPLGVSAADAVAFSLLALATNLWAATWGGLLEAYALFGRG